MNEMCSGLYSNNLDQLSNLTRFAALHIPIAINGRLHHGPICVQAGNILWSCEMIVFSDICRKVVDQRKLWFLTL